MNKPFVISSDLQTYLAGRSLLSSETPFSSELLQEHIRINNIQRKQGIEKIKKNWFCHRCGNEEQRLFAPYPCGVCEKTCYYCRHCIMMGRVSSCEFLYTWSGSRLPWEQLFPNGQTSSKLMWTGTLSPGQRGAAERAVHTVEKGEELLVWAVCGAGKTEVLFPAIEHALRLQKRVCVATPRTDVVLELAPRFKKVFPHVPIAVLYGGSEDRFVQAPLTISTTHQLLRFERCFDVMIIDEVDAFPYSADPQLQFAVKKSAAQHAATIYLTATPSLAWQKEVQSGKRAAVKIPARYHRHPLPLPTFTWCGDWKKKIMKGKIPRVVLAWIQKRLQQEKQCLLFFPDIQMMNRALPLFQAIHPNVDAVHAEDPQRKEKVMKMREKKLSLLLTTTILERGVTFPNIDVAILGAEDDIFTEAALVQIAGRVGRSAEAPSGVVTYFHYGRTNAMVRALLHMDKMNRLAKKQGLIE